MAYPTRIRYGLRLLARLAAQTRNGYVSVADIAAEEGVSVKYLEQIVGLLRPLGVLASVRGARGGYALTRDPAEVSLESVFESLGGLSAPSPCMDAADSCSRSLICGTRPFWLEFDAHIRNYLRSKSLADLACGQDVGFAKFARPALSVCDGLTVTETARKRKSL